MLMCIIPGNHRRDQITLDLGKLHWLPVLALKMFNIVTLVYKVRDIQWLYLAELLMLIEDCVVHCDQLPNCCCLSECTTLKSPSIRFAKLLPKFTWNDLSESIRTSNTFGSFRKHLKIYKNCPIVILYQAGSSFSAPTNSSAVYSMF